jgi:hypothetical protein
MVIVLKLRHRSLCKPNRDDWCKRNVGWLVDVRGWIADRIGERARMMMHLSSPDLSHSSSAYTSNY